MAHIVNLNAQQEANLQAHAEEFVRQHKGDTMRALKEMLVLNSHLAEQVEALSGELKYPRLVRGR